MDAQTGSKSDTGKDQARPKPRPSVSEFIAQVRQEVAKVTWPTRKETTTTAIAVLIMVLMAMVFFFSVDWAIGHLVNLVLDLV